MSERDLIEELQAISDDRHGAKNTHLLSWLEKGYFHCQHGSEEWCQGDYLDSARAYIERLEAVSKASLATIASLSEALAEAEKKGAEAREVCEERDEDLAVLLDAIETLELSGTLLPGREAGRVAGIKAFLTLRRRIPAPPRDLSQGGQHG